MKYQTIFFDLDDTILDFKKAEDLALQLLFDHMDVELTDQIKKLYEGINKNLWNSYEQGQITRETVTGTRFSKLFEELGYEVDGVKADEKYRDFLTYDPQYIGQAEEIIKDLSNKADLILITNGVSKTQRTRLAKTGLDQIFSHIIISEETGYQKPSKEIFNYAFEKIAAFDKSKAVMIGDSLSSDISGGNNAEIDTIWLNNKNIKNTSSILPTYEISDLKEIYKIL